jgi:hypothetical protein
VRTVRRDAACEGESQQGVSGGAGVGAVGRCDASADDALTAIRRTHTGVAFASSAHARGCVVTAIYAALVIVGVITINAGFLWLFMRLDRASRQRIERQREAWRAGGCVGPEPEPSWKRVQGDGTVGNWYQNFGG